MREYPKYKKVLFCTDFSENSDYAFDFAYGIAKRDEGLLYILHVLPDNPQLHQAFAEKYITKDNLEKIRRDIKEELDNKYQEHYTKNIGDEVIYEIVTRSGRQEEEILKFAKEKNVDIIVMGTHGKTGIERVFFGSIADKVIKYSTSPVFIIPCKKKIGRF
jgi:nucleotide-binding universal stress UspA family protein